MDENIIKEYIKKYTWYTPVDFGSGLIARGNFKIITTLESIHFGMGKWKYIIERNLPDLQGKRVMDIGCNNGIFCIEMARMGAKEVIGVDCEKTWPNWLEQAKFVKEALEWRCNTKYNIKYLDSDMARIPDLNLGYFDVVTALCCLYYLEDEKINSLLNYFRENSNFVLIQCNIRRRDQTLQVHRRAAPRYIGTALRKAGFPHIRFDKPLCYERPVVVGSKYPLENKMDFSAMDRIRYWIRKKI